jgi:hypothetical protein
MNFLTKAMVSIISGVMLVASAQATLITINDTTEVGVLDLSESFVNFYDYDNGKQWSSDTGFEEVDTMVMFLARYNNQLALFTLLDGNIPGNTTAGSLSVLFSSLTDIGSILLIDDGGEATDNGNSWVADWNWATGKGDGMIFLFDDANNFDLNIVFSNINNVDDGKFLSFDSQGQAQSISVPTEFNITAVPEPSTIAIFAMCLMGLASRRYMKKQ